MEKDFLGLIGFNWQTNCALFATASVLQIFRLVFLLQFNIHFLVPESSNRSLFLYSSKVRLMLVKNMSSLIVFS